MNTYKLTSHQVDPINSQLEIEQVNCYEWPQCHRYEITGFNAWPNTLAEGRDGYRFKSNRLSVIFHSSNSSEPTGITEEALLAILIDRLVHSPTKSGSELDELRNALGHCKYALASLSRLAKLRAPAVKG